MLMEEGNKIIFIESFVSISREHVLSYQVPRRCAVALLPSYPSSGATPLCLFSLHIVFVSQSYLLINFFIQVILSLPVHSKGINIAFMKTLHLTGCLMSMPSNFNGY